MPYSPECQKIADQLQKLEDQELALSSALDLGNVPSKAAAAAQIKKLLAQISKVQAKLDDCVKKHPYVPPPAPPADPCTSLEDQLSTLQAELSDQIQNAVAALQQELQSSAGVGKKQAIVAGIKATIAKIMATSPLVKQIADTQQKLNHCITSHHGVLELFAIFSGTATMGTSNDNAPGPFVQMVTIGLDFSIWDHSKVQVVSFPPISVTYDTHSPAGMVTTTVSLVSGWGNYDRQSGSLAMNLSLYFHHSYQLAGDSTLTIQLRTTSLLDAKGNITVEGTGVFQGGYLDQDTCYISVAGNISPRP